jgi:hypothetical protein
VENFQQCPIENKYADEFRVALCSVLKISSLEDDERFFAIGLQEQVAKHCKLHNQTTVMLYSAF